MGKIWIEKRGIYQIYIYDGGNLEFRIAGKEKDRDYSRYVPVAKLIDQRGQILMRPTYSCSFSEEQEDFLVGALKGLKSAFKNEKALGRYREKMRGGVVDSRKVWRRIREINGLPEKYDILD